ncbi:SDR family oxidoreductase [soil metagenome]
MTIAVTGSTGTLGRLLLPRLSGADIRPLTRADGAYDETAKLSASLSGSDTLFLVSGRESANRVAEHYSAIEAAMDAGVKRIVYLSFYGAAPDCTFTFGRDHFHTEQRIRETGLDFTFLRDNFYQGILPHFADESGIIRGPGGDGLLSAVSNTDVADVAAAVLTGGGHDGATYDLTGPEELSFPAVAATLSRTSGREVTFVDETIEEAYASRAHYGAPPFEVDGWVTTYLAVARGECAGISGDVEALTGHPAQSFEEYLASPSLVE